MAQSNVYDIDVSRMTLEQTGSASSYLQYNISVGDQDYANEIFEHLFDTIENDKDEKIRLINIPAYGNIKGSNINIESVVINTVPTTGLRSVSMAAGTWDVQNQTAVRASGGCYIKLKRVGDNDTTIAGIGTDSAYIRYHTT